MCGKSGQHRATIKLQPSSTARTIREKNGGPVITDGPFVETKEQLGGCHLIECKDIDQAISIARRIPTIPFGGAVEVRQLFELEDFGPSEAVDRFRKMGVGKK